jgi:hypothetical protein
MCVVRAPKASTDCVPGTRRQGGPAIVGKPLTCYMRQIVQLRTIVEYITNGCYYFYANLLMRTGYYNE